MLHIIFKYGILFIVKCRLKTIQYCFKIKVSRTIFIYSLIQCHYTASLYLCTALSCIYNIHLSVKFCYHRLKPIQKCPPVLSGPYLTTVYILCIYLFSNKLFYFPSSCMRLFPHICKILSHKYNTLRFQMFCNIKCICCNRPSLYPIRIF